MKLINKSGMILFSAGLLALSSLCATSGVSWMLPLLLAHYGKAAYYLTSLPPFASAVGLLLAPLFARWLTPARVITGGFAIMCLCFILLATLPILGIALAASVLIGLVAVGIGSIHTAAPVRAGTTPEVGSTVINGVFTIGTFFATYGVARVAVSLGPSGGLGALSLITAVAALGAWLLFGRKSLPTATQSVPATSHPKLREIWSKQVIVVGLLAASNKVAIGAVLATLAVVLVNTSTFGDPIWLAVANASSIPAGLLMLTIWRKRSTHWADNGLSRAAWATLAGALLLLLTLGPVGIWWIAAQWFGLLGLFIGAAYEQGAYALIQDTQGGRKTLINFGIAMGFTAGVWLGNWVVGSLGFLPVLVALPASLISLAATFIAQPLLRRWVAEKRAAERVASQQAVAPQQPAPLPTAPKGSPLPSLVTGTQHGVSNPQGALQAVSAARAELEGMLDSPPYKKLAEIREQISKLNNTMSVLEQIRAARAIVAESLAETEALDKNEARAAEIKREILTLLSGTPDQTTERDTPSVVFQRQADFLEELEQMSASHEQSLESVKPRLNAAGTTREIHKTLEVVVEWFLVQTQLKATLDEIVAALVDELSHY